MPDTKRDLYGVESPPFVRRFRRQARVNRQQIRRWYKSAVTSIERILDLHYAFACQHVWTFNVTRSEPTVIEKLQFSAVHKNHLALFAISEMTQAGFFWACAATSAAGFRSTAHRDIRGRGRGLDDCDQVG